MKQKSWQRRQLLGMILALFVAVFFYSLTVITAKSVPSESYEIRYAAAQLMEQCMEQVKEYKSQLGMEISEEDWHESGMIGDSFSTITTTVGSLESKRTTANSDMAALVVCLLEEAGVKEGDTIGAGFSGSFPALNLAVLCACQCMGVECVYIASVGASAYGANQPELTFPDMACRLVQDGILDTLPVAITPGGADDIGYDMDPDTLEEIWRRLDSYGVTLYQNGNFEENLNWRMSIYRSAGISCFVGVGGNITTLGNDGNSLGQGVIPPIRPSLITEGSGLLARYSAQNLPVISLLNIKKLVADYQLPFDPEELPPMGTSAIYEEPDYSRIYPIVGTSLSLILLIKAFCRKREEA